MAIIFFISWLIVFIFSLSLSLKASCLSLSNDLISLFTHGFVLGYDKTLFLTMNKSSQNLTYSAYSLTVVQSSSMSFELLMNMSQSLQPRQPLKLLSCFFSPDGDCLLGDFSTLKMGRYLGISWAMSWVAQRGEGITLVSVWEIYIEQVQSVLLSSGHIDVLVEIWKRRI